MIHDDISNLFDTRLRERREGERGERKRGGREEPGTGYDISE